MDEQRQLKIGAAALLTLGLVLVLLFVAAVLGLWAWLLLGAIFVATAVTAFFVYARKPRHPTPVDAPHPAPPADGTRRVLVVADETCTPDELSAALTANGGGRVEAFVVAPALSSRVARWTNDEHAYEAARKRLSDTLAAFAALGIPADGHVGSHDPMTAADEGLREFPASEIVFASAGDDNWLEAGVVEEARIRYGIAVTQVGGTDS